MIVLYFKMKLKKKIMIQRRNEQLLNRYNKAVACPWNTFGGGAVGEVRLLNTLP